MLVSMKYDIRLPDGYKAVKVFGVYSDAIYTCIYQTLKERVHALCRAQKFCANYGLQIDNFIDSSKEIIDSNARRTFRNRIV